MKNLLSNSANNVMINDELGNYIYLNNIFSSITTTTSLSITPVIILSSGNTIGNVINIGGYLTAGNNNQTLSGLFVNPIWNSGTFTGLTKNYLNLGNKFRVDSDGNVYISSLTNTTNMILSVGINGILSGITLPITTGLTSINNLTQGAQFLTTGSTGLDFQILSTGSTHQFNIPTASSGNNRGLLSGSDWNTFNTKQNALGFIPYNSTNPNNYISGNTVLSGTYNNLLIDGKGLVISGTNVQYLTSFTQTLQNTVFTGDLFGSGTTAVTLTLNSIITPGSVGSNTQIPVLTYDSKGRLTLVSSVTVATSSSFSGITSINNQTNIFQTLITGSTGQDFNILSTSGVHQFNIPTVNSGNTRGLLSGSDWTVFNLKQNALGFIPYNSTNPNNYISGNTVLSGTYNTLLVDSRGLVISGTNVQYLTSFTQTLQNSVFSGDLFGSGTTGVTLTLNSITSGQTVGSSTQIPVITYDNKGRIISSTTVNVVTGITSINNITQSSQFLTTGNTGLDFQILSTSGIHQFNIPTTSSGTTRGLLSGSDWNTFNTKQNALGFIPYNSINPSNYISGNTVLSGTYNTVLVDSKGLVISGTNIQYLTSFTQTLQNTVFTGDLFGSGTTAVTLTLNSITSGQTVGSSIQIPVITYDNKGRIVSSTSVNVVTGITSINNLTQSSQFLTTGNTGLDFQILSTGNTHQFNIPTASSGTTRGLLLGSDWNTFNTKQNVLGFIPYNSTNPNNYISGNTVQSGTFNNLLIDSKGLVISGTNIQYLTSFTQTLQSSVFTGDLFGSGTTAVTLTLNSIITAGSVGSNTQIPVLTYDNKGRLTLVSSVTVATSASFSGITSINNQTNIFQTLITGSTGQDFNILSTSGVHQFNIPTANSGNTRGLLSGSDWNTFNTKQNALGFIPYNSTNPNNYISGNTVLSGTYNTLLVDGRGLVISGTNVQYLTSFTQTLQNSVFSGDLFGSGTTAVTLTLNSITSGQTVGSSTQIPIITYDNKGRIISSTSVSITTGITSINNLTQGTQFLTTGNTGQDFNILSTGSTHQFNIPTASSGTTRGLLSGSDWNTFNTKQNALGFIPYNSTNPNNYISGNTVQSGTYNTLLVDSKGLVISGTNIQYLTSFTQTLQSSVFTGDLFGSGTTAVTLTLNSITSGQTVGSSTQIPIITYDNKGRIISSTTVSITTGLTSINNLTQSSQFLITGSTGQDFNILSTSGVHQFNIPTANSGTTRGLLSAQDWNTFNTKQSPLGFIPYNSTNPSNYISGNTVLSGTYNNLLIDSKGLVISGTNIQYLTSFTQTLQSSVFTGDLFGSGTTAVTLTLNSIITPGSIGSNTQIPVLTYDSKGRLTLVSSVTVATSASFSGITSINNQTNIFQTLITGSTGQDFNILSTSGVHQFNIPTANSGTTRGLLLGSDWTVFNTKQSALGFIPYNSTNPNNYISGNTVQSGTYNNLLIDSKGLVISGSNTQYLTSFTQTLQNSVFSGDLFGSGTTAVTLTLNSITSGQTVGSSTQIPVITYDNKGRIVSSTTVSITTGITSINNLTQSSQFLTTGSTGLDFQIISSGGTHQFNIPTANSGTTRGLLSGSDWNTFNAKQNALGFIPYNSTNPSNYISGNTVQSGTYNTLLVDSKGLVISGTNIQYLTSFTQTLQNSVFTGDLFGSGTTAVTLTLNSITSGQTVGSSTQIPVITYDNKGRIVSSTTVSITTGITSINNLTQSSQFLTTGSTGLDFQILSSGGVHQFNIPTASSGTTRGLLSAQDWNTFNTKQNALGFIPYNSTNPSNYISGNTVQSGTYNNVLIDSKGLVISGTNVQYLTSFTQTLQTSIFSGDLFGSGTTAVTLTLNSITTGQTVGSSTQIPVITYDNKGRIVSSTTVNVVTGITSINNLTQGAQFLTTGSTGLDFQILSTGSTHQFNIPTASSGNNRGLLSGSDWTVFNTKQNALGFIPYNSTNPSNYISGNTVLSGTYNNLLIDSKGLVISGTNTQYLTSFTQTLQNSVFTGDLFGSGTTAVTLTLNSIITAGSVGSNTQIPVLTYDSKGRLTLVSSVTVATSASFSGITTINNQTNTFQTLITGSTGQDFNILSTSGVHQFNIPTVNSGNTRGLLSGSDWTVFNLKQNALGFIPYNSTNPNNYISGNTVLSGTYNTLLVDGRGLVISGSNTQYLTSFTQTLQNSVFTGDLFGSGTTAVTLTLNSITSGQTVGSSTQIPVITYDNKGRIVSSTTVSMMIGITSINNLTQGSQFLTTGSTGQDFQILSTGSTHQFNIPTANSGNTRGLLLGSDWTIFNAKQNALGFIPYNSTNPNNYISGNTVLSSTYNNVLIDGRGLVISGTNIQYLTSFTQTLQTSIFSGDLFGSGTTAFTLTLNSITTGATVGSSTQIPIITYDNKGRIVSSTTVSITTGLTSINNLTQGTQFLTTGSTGLDFNILSSGGVHQFNIPTVNSGVTRGLLSSQDWNTFNTKQNALGFIPYNSTNPNNYISGNTVLSGTYNNLLIDSKGLVISGTNVQYLTSFTQTLQNSVFTGDLFGSGTTAVTLTLNSIITAGSVGSSTQIPVLTYDSKGRLTLVSSVTVATTPSFSGITSINNQTNIFQTLITGSTGLDFNILSTGGIHQFNIPTVNSGTTRGLLLGSDWTVFNTKQNALGFIPYNSTNPSNYISGNTVQYGTYNNLLIDSKGLVISGTNVQYLTSFTQTLQNSVFTGDLFGSGTTAVTLTLNSITSGQTVGSSTQIPVITYDNKGRIVSSTTVSITTGITSINNITQSSQFLTTGSTGLDFQILSSGGIHQFNIPTASSGTTRGLLSGSDWTVFNLKQNALGFIPYNSTNPSNYISGNTVQSGTYNTLLVDSKGLVISGTNIQYLTSFTQTLQNSVFTGDLFGSGTTAVTLTLNSITSGQTVGSSTQIPVITYDNKGRIVSSTTVSITTGITSINNITQSSQFLTTGSTGLDFQILSSGGIHQFNIPTANSGNTRGLLSGQDWNTFNAKQNTLGYSPLSGNTVLSGTYNNLLIDNNGLVISGTNVQYLTSFTQTLQSSVFTGDLFGSGTTAFTLTLNSITSGQTVGSSTQIPVITYDNKGRIISSTTVSITTGLTSINNLTQGAQFLITGSTGQDFNILSTGGVHQFNIPTAGSGTTRGLLSGSDWSRFNLSLTATTLPGGTNGQIQYNNNGVFNGDSGFTWDKINSKLAINTPVPLANFHLTGLIQNSGTNPLSVFTAAPHTNQTASAEIIDVLFNLNRTLQWASGNVSTQRSILIQPPIYSFLSASTISDAATFAISGSPIAGVNATLTRKYAAWIQSGNLRVDGQISSRYGSNLAIITEDSTGIDFKTANILRMTIGSNGGLSVFAGNQFGGSNNQILVLTAGAHTSQNASTEMSDVNVNLNRTLQWATGNITLQRSFLIQAPTFAFVGASTIAESATLAITGPPIAGTNATLTNSYGILLQSGTLKINSFSGSTGAKMLVADNSGIISTQAIPAFNRVPVTGSTYSATSINFGGRTILGMSFASGRTVTLPIASGITQGTVITVKDEAFSASIFNIVVNTQGGALIDFNLTDVLNINGMSKDYYTNGTNYFVI